MNNELGFEQKLLDNSKLEELDERIEEYIDKKRKLTKFR